MVLFPLLAVGQRKILSSRDHKGYGSGTTRRSILWKLGSQRLDKIDKLSGGPVDVVVDDSKVEPFRLSDLRPRDSQSPSNDFLAVRPTASETNLKRLKRRREDEEIAGRRAAVSNLLGPLNVDI